ncbi:hypothetical protein D3C80_1892040 [compost metagenome]
MRKRIFHHHKLAVEISSDNPFKRFDRVVNYKRVVTGDGCVVIQAVNFTVAFDGFLDNALYNRLFRNVALDKKRLSALFSDFTDRSFSRFGNGHTDY